MNARTKSILIISVALLAGILIGALSVGAVVNYRVDQLRELRRPGGFSGMVEDVVQPESPEQRRAIQEALQQAGDRSMALRQSMRLQHLALLDSLRSDLEVVLTPAQLERLERWIDRQHHSMRNHRNGRGGLGGPGRRGPGPGRGGGPLHNFAPLDSADVAGDTLEGR